MDTVRGDMQMKGFDDSMMQELGVDTTQSEYAGLPESDEELQLYMQLAV